MSEMIERLARALHGCVTQQGTDRLPWEQLSRPLKEECLFLARAAVEAMREPINQMIEAADGEYRDDDRRALVGEWQTMIDVALRS
jgi:hypothetical protein